MSYIMHIKELITDGESSKWLKVKTPEQTMGIYQYLFGMSIRRIVILSTDLSEYDHAHIVSAAMNAVRRGVRISIISQKPPAVNNSFYRKILELKSYAQYYQQIRVEINNFDFLYKYIAVDGRMLWYKSHLAWLPELISINRQDTAKTLFTHFDLLVGE